MNTSKTLRAVLLAVALATGTVACKKDNVAPDTTLNSADTAAEQASIRKLIAAYGKALAASDAEKVTSLFAPNAILLSAGAPTVTGAAQIKSSYEGLFSALTLTLEFTLGEIVVVDRNYAFATSTSTGTVLVKANGQSAPGSYRELWVSPK